MRRRQRALAEFVRVFVKPPRPEPCCPKCERIARAHGWTPESGESVRAYMERHGLKEDEMAEIKRLANDFRTADELDAYLRAKEVRTVTTVLLDDGRACVEVSRRDGSVIGHGHGPTASHAFDAMLGGLAGGATAPEAPSDG